MASSPPGHSDDQTDDRRTRRSPSPLGSSRRPTFDPAPSFASGPGLTASFRPTLHDSDDRSSLPLPAINTRRHSSASPPPHLPALTLQRPSGPTEGQLPPIAPLPPMDHGSALPPSFNPMRRGSTTDPSQHVSSPRRGSPSIGSPSSRSTSPTSMQPSGPSSLRYTASSSSTPPYLSQSPFSTSSTFPSFTPLHQTRPSNTVPSSQRRSSLSPVSHAESFSSDYRMGGLDDGLSPRGAPHRDDGSRLPPMAGGPLAQGYSPASTLPPVRSASGAAVRPWETPSDSGSGGGTPIDGNGEERDRFSHLPQFDYSQRRHSIAVGYPTPSASLAQPPPVLPPSNGSLWGQAPPPNVWHPAALKRKMSHDRAAFPASSSSPFPPSTSSDFEASLSPGASSGAGKLPSVHSDSSMYEGGPLKRRGSAYDTKMSTLSLADDPASRAMPPPGGWWVDRRDSSASIWSNASHVSSTGGGYGTGGSVSQTSWTGGSEQSGQGSATKGYGSHFPGGSFQWPASASSTAAPSATSRPSSPVPSNQPPSVPSQDSQDFRTFRDYSIASTVTDSTSRANSTVGLPPSSLRDPVPRPHGGLPASYSSSSSSSAGGPFSGATPAPSGDPSPASSLSPAPHRSSVSRTPSARSQLAPASDRHTPPSSEMLAPPTGEDGETSYSRSPELRVSHKLAERKRRKEMKELFDELRDQLPADRSMKASKWEILSRSVDFITQLKNSNSSKDLEIQSLRREIANNGHTIPNSTLPGPPPSPPGQHSVFRENAPPPNAFRSEAGPGAGVYALLPPHAVAPHGSGFRSAMPQQSSVRSGWEDQQRRGVDAVNSTPA